MSRISGFMVCGAEVLRSDGMFEFVSLHGDPTVAATLLGRARPGPTERSVFGRNAEYGSLNFVPAETLTRTQREFVEVHGAVPEVKPAARGDWRPDDMLMCALDSDDGVTRAVVHFDVPRDGKRPNRKRLRQMWADLELLNQALLTAVEHEAYHRHAMVGAGARKVIRESVTDGANLRTVLDRLERGLSPHFGGGLMKIFVFQPSGLGDQRTPGMSKDLAEALVSSMRRSFERNRVVVVERDSMWGDDAFPQELRGELWAAVTGYARAHGLRDPAAAISVPIGAAGTLVGGMTLLRHQDQPRWTDSESQAAFEVGNDVGFALLNTIAFEREQTFNQELRDQEQHRSEMIRTISHELNNPLTVLVAHLEEMAGEEQLSPHSARSINAMDISIGRLRGLASRLLELSRVSSGEQQAQHELLDLGAIIRRSVSSLDPVARQASITLQLALPEAALIVRGDEEDCEQIVSNLVSNAVKYSDAGGVVRVAADIEDDQIVFTVSDTGIGISEEDQEKLMTEFFRSTNSAALARPGTGLGLAIVDRAVRRHGGDLRLQSRLGRGSTFTARLPLAQHEG